MKKKFIIIAITLVGVIGIGEKVNAQTSQQTAASKAKEAFRLEDEEGKFDEAIKLLEEAQKLDPEKIEYAYETAYTYILKKDYSKAADILENLLNNKNAYSRVYQALGNVYDFQGKPGKAIETYQTGLKKFPNAGELYLEMGNMHLNNKDYEKALNFYEKGIEVNPEFPSNYYWASRIYLNSTEEVWGMLYGEIFMNLERNSERTAEISKRLFDTYKSEIQITSDTSFSVSFSQNQTINVASLKDPKKFKLPFGTGCYEMVLMMAIFDEKHINIHSLNNIRTRFLDRYFANENDKKYPNILFDYQQKIKNAGHFEAYNYWLLMKGDEDNFLKWKSKNETKWNAFIKWFSDNGMQVSKTHKFFRNQY